jgi:hypothetical protein
MSIHPKLRLRFRKQIAISQPVPSYNHNHCTTGFFSAPVCLSDAFLTIKLITLRNSWHIATFVERHNSKSTFAALKLSTCFRGNIEVLEAGSGQKVVELLVLDYFFEYLVVPIAACGVTSIHRKQNITRETT